MNKKELLSHLERSGFLEKTLNAFKKVKREDFIPGPYKKYAYEDIALPLMTNNETISQPYTIAFMLDLLELKRRNKVLEIGSGSGYVLALLYELTKGKIYGVEIVKEIAKGSQELLKDNKKITIISGNGIKESKRNSPYDRILVSASAKDEKIIHSLAFQLKKDGIIVASVEDKIIKLKKQDGKVSQEDYPGFVFVPLRDN